MHPRKGPTAPNVTFSEAKRAAPYVVSEGNKYSLPEEISCYPEIAVQNL